MEESVHFGVHLWREKPRISVHFPHVCISEGGRCTPGVHLSDCTYTVYIHEVVICSLYKNIHFLILIRVVIWEGCL
jgi:hypothetical protein